MNIKQLIQNYMEQLWNQKNIEIIDDIFTDKTIIHSPLKITYGKEEMRQITQRWLHAFPDLHCQWEDWIVEHNKIASRWIATGTHLGNFLNFSSSGKKIKYIGVSIFKLENNKVLEYWGLVDMQGIITQIKSG